MNYGMIATGNHCNSDSLRGAPLPAVKSSDIAPHFGKNVLLYGSHEWLPYSKDEVRLKTVNNNLSDPYPIFQFVQKGHPDCQLSTTHCQLN